MITVLVPNVIPLELSDSADVRFVVYDTSRDIPEEEAGAEGLVVWGVDNDQLRRYAGQLSRLRWVQTLAAGPDAVLAAGFDPRVIVTNGRSLHDDTVAEHALALSLAAVRDFPALFAAQRDSRWASELTGVQSELPSGPLKTLTGARVTIWGYGSIAARLAPLLTSLGAIVTGVSTRGAEGKAVQVLGADQLDALLPSTDLLIMILPATEETQHALNAAKLALLPARSWVVNVGRGATLDETAIVEALRKNRIAGACLDVFETEPLPADSPLWTLPNVFLTPHIAGGRPRNGGPLVAANAAALVAGSPLRNVVTR